MKNKKLKPRHIRNKRAKAKRTFLKNKGIVVSAKSIAMS